MSLPINESTQPGVPQPESNPTLEPVQNAEATVDKPAETLPASESTNEVANKPEIQNSNEEPKAAEPVSQPKEEEKTAEAKPETQSKEQEVKLPEAVSEPKEEAKALEPKEEIKAVESQEEVKPNLEAAKEENLDSSASQENVEAKEGGEGEEEAKPKRQYRKRGAKFDDFEKYNDTGSYIPATSRSGRAIKKATVFQAAEPAPTKRQRSTSSNTPADILIKKRGRKPKNAADSGKAQGGASKASGTKKKAGRPKKSDKVAATAENDSKPEEIGSSHVDSQSVPSATVENATIPAVLDNQSIPQQDSSISQFPPQLASNTLPQPTSQNFENPTLGINQNEPVSNVIPVQQQVPSNQFQQPNPIAPIVPTLSSNLPPASGYQPPVNNGIPPSFNPPAPVDQQVINNTVSKPGEIPAQFANPPPTQNQATFAAPTQFATDSAPTNTATYN